MHNEVAFPLHAARGAAYLTAPNIAARHAFSTRLGGVSTGVLESLNLSVRRGDTPENVRENWRRLGAAAGLDLTRGVYAQQVHSAEVRIAHAADAQPPELEPRFACDGFVTNEPGVPLAVFMADCLPALLHDPAAGVIGAVHCGWRGSVADILAIAKERGEAPMVVICDGVTDPYNLGAIIRCAECCGAHGLVIPKRRAAGLTPLVTKASAGAIEHLAIAKVPNIAAAVEELKEAGVWVYAAEAGGSSLWKTDFSGACAIVMGSEGDGVSQVVRKACDGIVSIPIYGQVNSFNVSTAAAVILAEVARQQHKEG